MKMKKLAIVLTVGAALALSGCGHMLVPGWGEMSEGERNLYRAKIASSFEKGFNKGWERRTSRPTTFGVIKGKTTFSDGTVIRSKTKYRTGFGGTKIETKYY